MVRLFCTAIALVSLTGCSKFFCKPEVITMVKEVRVEVPVSDTPSAEVFQLPYLPVSDISPEDTPDHVIKKYALTIEVLKNEVVIRDNALKPFQRKK